MAQDTARSGHMGLLARLFSRYDNTDGNQESSHQKFPLEGERYDSSLFCGTCKQLDNLESNISTLLRQDGDDKSHGYYLCTVNTDYSCPMCVFGFRARKYGTGSPPITLTQLHLGCKKSVIGFYSSGDEHGDLIAAITPLPGRRTSDELIYGQRLQTDKIDFQSMRRWISECCNSHDCGEPRELVDIPHLRLIDCNTKRVVHIQPGDRHEFVTLSYVWGKPSIDDPQTESLNAWLSDVTLPEKLPKVITDAITAVQELVYRYLWVDRYCIPQLSKEVERRQIDQDLLDIRDSQLSKMGLIYATSVFTIIAAAGDGPDFGLAGMSADKPRLPQPAIKLGDRFLVGVRRPESDISKSLWNTRGWTFQEAALSKRRLAFTSAQVYFQCQQGQYMETLSGEVPFDYSIVTKSVFPRYVLDGKANDFHVCDMDLWMSSRLTELFDSITKYAQRLFTYPGDAHDAFRGVTQRFKSLDPQLHILHGLPIISHSSTETRTPAWNQPWRWTNEQRETGGSIKEMDELSLALSWSYSWPDNVISSELEALLRRTHFPSWTWLGWRYYQYVTSTFQLFRDHRPNERADESAMAVIKSYLESAIFQFVDEPNCKAMYWNSEWREICEKAETHKIDSLEITGWLIDISIRYHGQEEDEWDEEDKEEREERGKKRKRKEEEKREKKERRERRKKRKRRRKRRKKKRKSLVSMSMVTWLLMR